eukprot:2618068-Prymnesium_polylepis.1
MLALRLRRANPAARASPLDPLEAVLRRHPRQASKRVTRRPKTPPAVLCGRKGHESTHCRRAR